MTSYITKQTDGDTTWFEHDRFGMFIHFGIFSLPARNEWVKSIELVSEEKYQKYFEHFNPDMLDARQWAKAAKEAGMKYAVLTTKHHDGFCLFDSKYTDYKVTNTPYGKDIVKEYVEAFRAEGIKIGLYYSLIDWHHPDFPIDIIHPRRYDENAEQLDKGRDMKKYAEYMRNQVAELLTEYGDISIMWFDFSYKKEDRPPIDFKEWMQHDGGKGKDEWEAEELVALARKLRPGIIIDNRAGLLQDLWTPETFQPTRWPRHPETDELVTWETCHTLSESSWCYHQAYGSWKTPEMLLNLLINTVSLGGNLIMNVGPSARGYLDYRAMNGLKVYADWMRYNNRAIYGCTMAEPEFEAPEGTRLTQSADSKRLYIHLKEYPFAFLEMKNLGDKIEYAQFLHDGSEVLYTVGSSGHFSPEGQTKEENMVFFHLTQDRPNVVVPVIEVFLK